MSLGKIKEWFNFLKEVDTHIWLRSQNEMCRIPQVLAQIVVLHHVQQTKNRRMPGNIANHVQVRLADNWQQTHLVYLCTDILAIYTTCAVYK